jgi:Exostosin family
MKIFIPEIKFAQIDKRSLFILTRPFFTEIGWSNDHKDEWNIDNDVFYTNDIEQANYMLIPMNINWYFDSKNQKILKEYNTICKNNNIQAYGFIGGDFGIYYPDFSNIYYFRLGGFKKQLSPKNLGFPVSLSDHFQRIFGKETITPTTKRPKPVIGFCGHSNLSQSKRFKEIAKCLLENLKRFFKNPFNNVYEPMFASAFERAKLLNLLEKNIFVDCNFIHRPKYRGGLQTAENRMKTTMEYYHNIKNSDYIICIRGGGNFSVRFYETLMMGKIPVFVDSDCLLPFEKNIEWKNNVVWIDWKERNQIAEKILHFHNNISDNNFVCLQIENRQIWKEKLSINNMLNLIK